MKNYGKELIIDLHMCNPDTFNRRSIKKYFRFICQQINMQPEKIVWWDYLYIPQKERDIEAHLVGTSAVQFIKTSNITIHTLDSLKRVYSSIKFFISYVKKSSNNYLLLAQFVLKTVLPQVSHQ